jgi:membrane associated rhomboid family serine protease
MFEQRPSSTVPTGVRSRAWLWLVLANVGVFVAERSIGDGGRDWLARFHLLPSEVFAGKVWQLVTFQFLHVNLTHLVMNCLGLYFFGSPVGEHYRKGAVGWIYLVSGAMGGAAHCILGWRYPEWYGRIAVVGASAGVYGLVGAFCWIHWADRFKLCLPFTRWGLPFSGRRLFALFLFVGVVSMLDLKSGVAHDAHLGGMFMGVWMAQSWLKPRVPEARADPAATS